MHDSLKRVLTFNEDIWIYDEPNQCAILRKTFDTGRVLYAAMAYDGFGWLCIDVEQTDEHGAQFMYECLKKAINAARSV